MLKLVRGNLLEAKVDALVNAVNTEGVMGKGIALQFKQAYPKMYVAYRSACKAGQVKLGKMHLYEKSELFSTPRWIINFPTKGHWTDKSRIEDIKTGLQDLLAVVESSKMKSIAIPALGCGYGGLDWKDVCPLIEHAFASKTSSEVLLYVPES